MLSRFRASALAGLAAWVAASPALARESDAEGPNEQRIQAWLASNPESSDVSKAPQSPEAPPPPPRKHGFVVESSIGALGQTGDLRRISPVSPWLRAAFGWEPTHWIMVLAEGDLAFSSTSKASPPPGPRGYTLWGLGGAVRFGVQPWPSVGLFAQGEIGVARVTSDVLSTYGFRDADQIGPYFGGLLGVEWYQVSPHTALVLNGGVRAYGDTLERAVDTAGSLAWLTSAGLKYTF